jgi:hypothetical protein
MAFKKQKNPGTCEGLGVLVFQGCVYELQTASDPATFAGKIKVPIIGG